MAVGGGEQRLVKDESRDLWMGVQMLLNEDAVTCGGEQRLVKEESRGLWRGEQRILKEESSGL